MRYFFFMICVLLLSNSSYSQTDSLVFKNGNFIVGEIKSLDKGVLVVGTEFSDSDFRIDWEGIKSLHSENYLFILTSDKSRYFGKLESTSDSTINILSNNTLKTEVKIQSIVMLIPIDKTIKYRFNASIDFGFSLTKANSLKQFSSRSTIGYKAEKWNSEAVFNFLRSSRENADTIQRGEAGMEFRYLFYSKWYTSATVSMLSNTEQNIELRNNIKAGFGRYIIHTNKSYWTFRLGINRNIERFSDGTPNRNSWEPYMGTDIDLFDIGDFSLSSKVNAYRSITEAGRWRVDAIMDIKYNLPLDLYIKGGISFNYDNQPAREASDLDYILQTGIGWQW